MGDKVQNRYDLCGIVERLDDATVSPEGTIRANCVITNIGVFTYRNPDGTLRRELRCPEEVFNEDSIASLNGVPVTNLHHGLLDDSNRESLTVGHLDNDVTHDAYYIHATVNVDNADAAEDVSNGDRCGLSAGYTCTIDYTSGTWLGVRYDCIQRNIRYNHVALVPKGRAGDEAVIRMDGADDSECCVGIEKINNEEPTMNKKTIRLDEAEVEVDENVASYVARQDEALKNKEAEIAQLREDAVALTAEKDKMEAERDSLKDERDAFKVRLDEMEKEFPGKVAKAVEDRLALVAKAASVGVEVKQDASDKEIKDAVISKAFPGVDFAGKSEDYMACRLDCAFDKLASMKEAEETRNTRQDSADVPNPEAREDEDTVSAAKKRQDERLRNACK